MMFTILFTFAVLVYPLTVKNKKFFDNGVLMQIVGLKNVLIKMHVTTEKCNQKYE